jgi:hypothetical protein
MSSANIQPLEPISCQRTGTGAGVSQIHKFNGSTSWAVLRWQFEITAQHNGWAPTDKAAYMTPTLSPLHTFYIASPLAKYEEGAVVLENSRGIKKNLYNVLFI